MKLSEKATGRGYGSLDLVPESAAQVFDLLKDLGVTGFITDLHITLIYDRSNPKIRFKIDDTRKYKAKVSKVELLGEPGTKWYAVVLTLSAPEIEARHKDYLKAGFKHSYPNFIVHMSLKYKPSKNDVATIQDNVESFKKLTLVFSDEKLKKIKED